MILMVHPYNAVSKCLLCLAIVKFEKSDEYIRSKQEPVLLGVPTVVPLGNLILRLAAIFSISKRPAGRGVQFKF